MKKHILGKIIIAYIILLCFPFESGYTQKAGYSGKFTKEGLDWIKRNVRKPVGKRMLTRAAKAPLGTNLDPYTIWNINKTITERFSVQWDTSIYSQGIWITCESSGERNPFELNITADFSGKDDVFAAILIFNIWGGLLSTELNHVFSCSIEESEADYYIVIFPMDKKYLHRQFSDIGSFYDFMIENMVGDYQPHPDDHILVESREARPATPSEPTLSSNLNYIHTRTYTTVDGSRYLDQIQYFDGLGRPMQTVQRGITPEAKDLVTLQEYDAFGRESNTWLPAVISGNNGAFVTPPTVKAAAISSNGGDQKPYSMPVYEASPLNRVLQQFGPGQNWQSNSKSVNTDYKTNVSGDAILNCKLYRAGDNNQSPTLSQTGNYATGELYVTEVKDEDGNISCEFKDKLGQVVLTRQINDGQNYDTYYVYNVFGMQCYVLPPKIQDEGISQAKLDELAYQYRYDNRNRCIGKKIPGAEWNYYIYDKADRLIFSQDGEQRDKGEWAFSMPDVFGRVVLTGTCANSIDYPANPFADIVVKAEYPQRGSGTHAGYNLSGVDLVAGYKILSANYYDNYKYRGLAWFSNAGMAYESSGIEDDYLKRYGTDDDAYHHKGHLTGSMTAQIYPDGTLGFFNLYTCLYYDERGRVIQIKSTNHMAGIEKEYIAYNYTGQPVKKLHIHTKDALEGGKQTEAYAYTYDHAGRLLKTTHQLNGGATVTLAENTYDELGRLKTNKKGGQDNLNTTYNYNVRSWTSDISSYHFNERLAYTYNGNISRMQWQQVGKWRTYDFAYDNLSRLKTAAYTGDGNFSTAYSYDKHGNMLTLLRYGLTDASTYGIIDELTMTYTGNQMKTVDDAAANISLAESMDFKNGSNAANEYAYNRNGAMTKDLNKGITEIQYNSLNLPRQMIINSPSVKAKNYYTYSASGVKLKTRQRYDPNYTVTPSNATSPINDGLSDYKDTDYVGNIIYEKVKSGSVITNKMRILVDGGYIEDGVYHYYISDHLDNNRVIANSSGTVIQSNQYYPFGMSFADAPMAEQGKQPYKYNGKELDMMHGLNLYDYSARHLALDVPRFSTVDPLAEMYPSISPYAYCNNNPVRFIDPTGMAYGDFLDEKGNVIGNDGIDDERLYAMKTDASKESKKYIKDHSGDINSFRDADNIAYQNSIEIECNPTARQDMVNEVSKDNGKGGTKDANNREYGGSVENGVVAIATPGAVANPKTDATASIELPVGKSTFHSHPSGTIEDRSTPTGNVLGGGTTTTHFFQQQPSETDIRNAGSHTNYVFGRGDSGGGKVYIYNSSGTQAAIPMKRFVTPKR